MTQPPKLSHLQYENYNRTLRVKCTVYRKILPLRRRERRNAMIKCIVKSYGSHASGTYTTQKEYYGKSTDDKATCQAQTGHAPENADLFLEMDTGAIFKFDGETQTWLH